MQQKIVYSETEMMADLAATFPGMFIRPLSEYGSAWVGQPGVWTGGDEILIDDTPIFAGIACPDPDIYDGQVSHAFIAWLDRRGWYCEWWDGLTFHLRPDTGEW